MSRWGLSALGVFVSLYRYIRTEKMLGEKKKCNRASKETPKRRRGGGQPPKTVHLCAPWRLGKVAGAEAFSSLFVAGLRLGCSRSSSAFAQCDRLLLLLPLPLPPLLCVCRLQGPARSVALKLKRAPSTTGLIAGGRAVAGYF